MENAKSENLENYPKKLVDRICILYSKLEKYHNTVSSIKNEINAEQINIIRNDLNKETEVIIQIAHYHEENIQDFLVEGLEEDYIEKMNKCAESYSRLDELVTELWRKKLN